MTELNVGGTTKRARFGNMKSSRFGGEKAHRQHIFDDKSTVVCARRRGEQQHLASTLPNLELDVEEVRCSTNTCACTGFTPVRDGVVREGNITLVYSGGKLLAAHCG
ncbi:hypothetical protein BH10CYA1_BH10CYA1_41620 [soil metagenome]